jgi:hypothetical protein
LRIPWDATVQEWWEAQWTDAARFPLEEMPPAVLEQFRTEVFERLASFRNQMASLIGEKPA